MTWVTSYSGCSADLSLRIGSRRRALAREKAGAFRMMYLATRAEGVYVLHCFQKKTRKTSRSDLELAEKRFRSIPKVKS